MATVSEKSGQRSCTTVSDELLTFLSSKPWLRPLSPSTMMQLKKTFKLSVILKDAICSFHTQCCTNTNPQSKSKQTCYQKLCFLNTTLTSSKPTSTFSFEILLGVCPLSTGITDQNHSHYPSSLFFRIQQQFYLVNHTIIDELSFPKDPSLTSSSTNPTASKKHIVKMPVASMKIGNFQMTITFPENNSVSTATTTSSKPNINYDRNNDTNGDGKGDIGQNGRHNSVAFDTTNSASGITRLEALHRLANVATEMNQTLAFAVLQNHPAVLADVSYEYILERNCLCPECDHQDNCHKGKKKGGYNNDNRRDDSSTDDADVDTNANSSTSTVGKKEDASFEDNTLAIKLNKEEKYDSIPNKRAYDEHNCKNIDSITAKQTKDNVARKLMYWVDALDEFDYLLQPVMKSDQMSSYLFRNMGDNSNATTTVTSRHVPQQLMLTANIHFLLKPWDSDSSSSAAAGWCVSNSDSSEQPNVSVALHLVAQSMLSHAQHRHHQRVLASELKQIETEAYELLGCLFDSVPQNDNDNNDDNDEHSDDDGGNEIRFFEKNTASTTTTPCRVSSEQAKGPPHKKRRTTGSMSSPPPPIPPPTSYSSSYRQPPLAHGQLQPPAIHTPTIQAVVKRTSQRKFREGVEGNMNDDGSEASFSIDYEDKERSDVVQQHSQDSTVSISNKSRRSSRSSSEDDFPPPIPLSQFSYEEKRKYYANIDLLLETRLNCASQYYTSVVAVLPVRNDDFINTN